MTPYADKCAAGQFSAFSGEPLVSFGSSRVSSLVDWRDWQLLIRDISWEIHVKNKPAIFDFEYV